MSFTIYYFFPLKEEITLKCHDLWIYNLSRHLFCSLHFLCPSALLLKPNQFYLLHPTSLQVICELQSPFFFNYNLKITKVLHVRPLLMLLGMIYPLVEARFWPRELGKGDLLPLTFGSRILYICTVTQKKARVNWIRNISGYKSKRTPVGKNNILDT